MFSFAVSIAKEILQFTTILKLYNYSDKSLKFFRRDVYRTVILFNTITTMSEKI